MKYFVKLSKKIIESDREILKSFSIENELLEMDSFYCDDFYYLLQRFYNRSLKASGVIGGGGDYIMFFNVNLQDIEKRKLEALLNACENSYIPFYNNLEKDSFSLCVKLVKLNLFDKYSTEFAYRNNILPKSIRDRFHKEIASKEKEKFYEDRRLLNLSGSWKVIVNDKDVDDLGISKYPKVIYIGLLNECNMSCIGCSWFDLENVDRHATDYFSSKKQLSSDAVREIIEFAAKGNSKIIFSGPGEPLLDERIFDFIRYAKSLEISNIEIATNGVLLDVKTFQELLNMGVTSLSYVLSFNKQSYKFNSEVFQAVKKNMLQCAEWYSKSEFRDSNRVHFYILNVDSVDKVIREKFYEMFRYFMRVKKYAKEASINILDRKFTNATECQLQYRWMCPYLVGSMYIFPSGDVSFCEVLRSKISQSEIDSISFGNIYLNEPKDIWNSVQHRAAINEYKNDVQYCFDGSCKVCLQWFNDV